MAIKCTDDSVRSWLHVDILFLFVRPVFFANDVTIGHTLEIEVKKFRELDLGNVLLNLNSFVGMSNRLAAISNAGPIPRVQLCELCRVSKGRYKEKEML